MQRTAIRYRDRLLRDQQAAHEGGENIETRRSGEGEEGRKGGREEGEVDGVEGQEEGEEGGGEGSTTEGSVRGDGSCSSLRPDSASGSIPEDRMLE